MAARVKRHINLSSDADTWLKRAWPVSRRPGGEICTSPSHFIEDLILAHREHALRPPAPPRVQEIQTVVQPTILDTLLRLERLEAIARSFEANVSTLLDTYAVFDTELKSVRALATPIPVLASAEPLETVVVVEPEQPEVEEVEPPTHAKITGFRKPNNTYQISGPRTRPQDLLEEYVEILKRNGRPMSSREIAEQSHLAQKRYRDLTHAAPCVYAALNTYGTNYQLAKQKHPAGPRLGAAWFFKKGTKAYATYFR